MVHKLIEENKIVLGIVLLVAIFGLVVSGDIPGVVFQQNREDVVRLNYNHILADIELNDLTDIPLHPDAFYSGIQMRWDISSVPSNVGITEAVLCLTPSGSKNLEDNDAYIVRVVDQTWVESIGGLQVEAQLTDTLTIDKTFDNIKAGPNCIEVTDQIRADYLEGNTFSSFRMWDLDYVGDNLDANAVLEDQLGMLFGALNSDLSNLYGVRTHPNINERPTLDITYSTINGNGNNGVILDHNQLLEDITLFSTNVPRPEIAWLGFQMKWDISSIPSGIAIRQAELCLTRDSNWGTDRDAVISRVVDQTWTEVTSIAVFNSQTLDNIVSTEEFYDTALPLVECILVTQQIKADYADGNSKASVRLFDLDWNVDWITDKQEDRVIVFGATDASQETNFHSDEAITVSDRPTLNIMYTTMVCTSGQQITELCTDNTIIVTHVCIDNEFQETGNICEENGFLTGIITIIVMIGTIAVVVYFLFRRRGT